MKVRFWGVRGSFPAPGPNTVGIGGNTACVSVETDDHVLVLDAGTGIRELGESLAATQSEITLFTSHMHWDHVIGIPFFRPLYEPGRTVRFIRVRAGERLRSPLEIIDGIHFPRHRSELPAVHEVLEDERGYLAERGLVFDTIDLNHPGGATGVRVRRPDSGGLVYMSDNELGGSDENRARFDEFVAFSRGAEVLCHDAHYLDEEVREKAGWGHSSAAEVCRLAIAAEVRHVVLFHHDPSRTDARVAEIEAGARAVLEPHGIACTAAFEGLVLDLA